MPKAPITQKQAKKIKAAAKRVAKQRADKAGFLRQAFDGLGGVQKLLGDAFVEAEQPIGLEINILVEVIRRFRKRILTMQQAEAGAMAAALTALERVEAHLAEARGPGYPIKRMEAEAERDSRLLQNLRANIRLRAQEAAFTLAELEQAVDPLPGLTIAKAKARRENEKARTPQPKPAVAPEAGEATSKPIERSETL